MILAENQYGHGAIKNKIDLRDHKWTRLASAVEPFDWSTEYDVETELSKKLNISNFKIPVKDQGSSSSCVGQASAYYESVQDAFEKGVYTEKSARDAYSQIFYPGGGSSTRDALNLLTKKGICKELLLVSYQNGQPPSEQFIENRSDASIITINDALTAKGTAYASVNSDIDSFAQAIRDNHGIIFTVDAENNGTWLSKFPKPPTKVQWSHELYAGKVKMINGKKSIGFINSWGKNCGEQGWQWIDESYFKGGFVHSAGVIYDTQNDALNQQISWLQKVLELLQKLLFGTNTKIGSNGTWGSNGILGISHIFS